MLWAGQVEVPAAIKAAAALGEGGNCGHHQVMCGNCVAMTEATCRALVDCGDERNPCKYSTWVVGKFVAIGWLGLVMPNAISAGWDCPATGDNLAYAHRHSQTQSLSALDAFTQRF